MQQILASHYNLVNIKVLKSSSFSSPLSHQAWIIKLIYFLLLIHSGLKRCFQNNTTRCSHDCKRCQRSTVEDPQLKTLVSSSTNLRWFWKRRECFRSFCAKKSNPFKINNVMFNSGVDEASHWTGWTSKGDFFLQFYFLWSFWATGPAGLQRMILYFVIILWCPALLFLLSKSQFLEYFPYQQIFCTSGGYNSKAFWGTQCG